MNETRDQNTPSSSQGKFEGRMPVVFVGHGTPMNAIQDNRWSQGFTLLASLLPRPQAVLAVSAHWYVGGTYLLGDAQPRTIHDFGGFPKPLYEVQYPAPGQVDLAQRVRNMLDEHGATLSSQWGFDHGTWSVLKWMYPNADVPVVQLSIDRGLPVEKHHELARGLTDLRDQGVLILGSGNIVHNLRDAFTRMRSGSQETPQWAGRFDEAVRQATLQHDAKTLIALADKDDDYDLAHPTPDHWLPFVYALAATGEDDKVRFCNEGFDAGSLSMRSVIWG